MLIDEVGEGGERIMWIRNRHQTHKKGNIVSRPNSTILMILMEPMVASDGDTPSAEPRPIFFSLSSPLYLPKLTATLSYLAESISVCNSTRHQFYYQPLTLSVYL